MTKLPAKELLDGTKNPETTTGEFRLAMGNLRQFLFDLFGDESTDKETARQTLGIDLTQLNEDISKKADAELVEGVVKELVSDVVELANDVAKLAGEVASIVVAPVGTIYVQFAGQSTPEDLYGGTWENISPQYAGQFFRAEGGNAAAFGESQSQGLPNHTHQLKATGSDLYTYYGANYIYTTARVQNSVNGMINSIAAVSDNKIYGSSTEVRPDNSTIRIWKCIA
ncbi:hypothetical protein [Oxalobacter paraformigenes]|uniref:Tail fiber protein n=2 Tax=Oxalobacter paraformigenes TaxID=556268 RepID=C3X3L4_9BURK|nr:hypothetical protein [Oxalobacter paraformigenes]EEO27800.2 hypothetical protein OFAG_00953 [Oxalobacter paraformigenes]